MPTIVEMPRLSDTMTEGTLAEWQKAEGEMVEAGDALADIETDKAVMTFESFDSGVLLKVLVAPGDTVPLGTPIAVLGEEGEDVAALVDDLLKKVAAAGEAADEPEPEREPEPEPEPETEAEAPAPTPAPAKKATPAVSGAGKAPPAPTDDEGIRVKASPLARRIASERGIDLLTVEGTGPQGRILKRDVEGLDPTRRIAPGAAAPKEDEVIRVTQMRKTIAKRLVQSKDEAPHFYLTMTMECDRLVSLRKEINAAQQRQKISYNDLIMKACVVALQDHPEINAGWEGKTIRRFGNINIGFAVAMDEGLITPVVRAAETKGLIDMALEIRELAGRAREMKLDPEEYTGNSFCVSNLGMYGIEHFTAVINAPAACILAVGGLRQEPVVRDGELAVGWRMTVTMSCDHRVVDGAMGAAFMATLKQVIENPLGLFL